MSAAVTKGFGPGQFIAWCEQCQDGVRHASSSRAQAWADKHNRDRHS